MGVFPESVDSRLTGSARIIERFAIPQGDTMRRDMFLKSLAAMAAAGVLPVSAQSASAIKMMIPANPGGGWDTTGRALGKAMTDAGVAS